MAKYKVNKAYKYAHAGVDVKGYAGDADGMCEIPDDAAAVGIAEGWIEPAETKAAPKPDTKVMPAPENKGTTKKKRTTRKKVSTTK